ncbi:hypothetical protein AB0O26_10675 [Micrococcus luteus]|uniref:hypothetical protein n=1 Tax=Micrococcaceae TaxID=1268 RepID=UPI0015E0EE47|nr:hypothetical protein [Micrococcus luteus]MCV7583869.1 hypothetical protein [Micrococcus luteus]MCV7588309.1 hypothetical protein [Micrococcus luteus]MDK7330256.1 hypothetical protein [Micrococcus luteus]
MTPIPPTPSCPCAAGPRTRWWQPLPALYAGAKMITAITEWATAHIGPLLD